MSGSGGGHWEQDQHKLAPRPMAYLTSASPHGLITRMAHTHRYQVTDTGLSTARFLSAIHDRLLPTGLSHLTEPGPPRPLKAEPGPPRPLKAADRAYQHAIDTLTHTTGLAA